MWLIQCGSGYLYRLIPSQIKPIIVVPLHILVILLPKYKLNMFVRIDSIVMMHVVSVTRIIIVVQEEICTKNEIA